MLKFKSVRSFLFVSLACLLINSSSAVDQTPITRDNQSFLNLCWEPESSVWRKKPLTLSGQAHCKIENIVIQVFRKAWPVHEPLHLSHALVNAPLSGKSFKRGRNLLSFAAFNGFRRLALWGVINGSNINQGDADRVTMLGTAIADRTPYMLDFGIFYLNADPNIIYGSENHRVTALRDMVNHHWSFDALERMIKSGARVRDQAEFEKIQLYFTQLASSDRHLQLTARELMHILYRSGSLANPTMTQKPDRFYTDILKEIDRHILYAIEHNELTREDMDSLRIHGRNFYHFLAFNGFSQTIKYLLRFRLTPEQARKAVAKRDEAGYDMLLAAIHGNSADAVIEVLRASDFPVNLKVPSFTHYENQGKKPLDLAREWQSSPEVIGILLDNGATPLIQ